MRQSNRRRRGVAAVAVVGGGLAVWGVAGAQPIVPRDTPPGFVNWETPHGGSPLKLTADGTRLLAVNTADNRLEVFSIGGGSPVKVGSVPVGLDPVSVRARTNTEVWVVNNISDSVSVVDLTTMNVVATLKTQDEPFDVVFADGKAFVSCGQTRTVLVFDPANLAAAPTAVSIKGEQPRAMAVSADGTKVLVAVFDSGNHSTVLGGGTSGNNLSAFPPNVVSNAGPYSGVNPPPNVGGVNGTISPAQAVQPAPAVSLIVKKTGGAWMDDNGGDWTQWVSGAQASASGRLVGWDLYDNDVAIIDAATLGVTYAQGLMNICMAIGVNPATGAAVVVGTDGTNQVRFEPNITGKFIKVEMGSFSPASPGSTSVVDLNPHLTYAASSIPQVDRDKSLGDPRAVVFASSGTVGYVSGMGSNNVVVINGSGGRSGPNDVISVGKGPTGLALDEAHGRLYVLNKFDGSISTVSTASRAVVATTAFYDPTPAAIKIGRKHLYDTHKNSGLGQIACASCHIDGTMDKLAWDLGDPSGASTPVSTADRNLGQGVPGLTNGFQPYHSMKGPMTTQTLQDIIAHEPFHWRGDRLGLEDFNGAFIGLQGDDTNLTATEMQEFEDFLASIAFPPNPYRNFDNTLPTNLPLPEHFTTGRFAPAGQALPNGDAVAGLNIYTNTSVRLDGGALACVSCHTLPTGEGTDAVWAFTNFPNGKYNAIPVGPRGEHHLSLVSIDGTTNVTMKIPQLRNMYRKVGFNATQVMNLSGFGVLHDGSVDSIERFVAEPVFNVTSDQMVANLTAFMLAFSGSGSQFGASTNTVILTPPGPPSKDVPASVGAQTTAGATIDIAGPMGINAMLTEANAGRAGLVAHGVVAGVQRGYAYIGGGGGGNWQSDKVSQVLTTAALEALATAATPITFTVVPVGSQTRIGIDRDQDGWFDADELSVCDNPADPNSRPGTVRSIDQDGSLTIGVQDIFTFLSRWFSSAGDFNGDGFTTPQDIFDFLAKWFAKC